MLHLKLQFQLYDVTKIANGQTCQKVILMLTSNTNLFSIFLTWSTRDAYKILVRETKRNENTWKAKTWMQINMDLRDIGSDCEVDWDMMVGFCKQCDKL